MRGGLEPTRRATSRAAGRARRSRSRRLAARDDDGFAPRARGVHRPHGDRGRADARSRPSPGPARHGEPSRTRTSSRLRSRPIPEWAQRRAIDISHFVDRETLRSDFGEYLLSFGSSGASAARLPASGLFERSRWSLDLEGPRVLSRRPSSRRPGTRSPTTWDELVALSDRIVADGGTPWCFGFESGYASGWPGTDLIESLVLRVGGVDVYDAWTRGETGFTSPEVMEAGRLADELVFEPGYVRGGAGGDQR